MTGRQRARNGSKQSSSFLWATAWGWFHEDACSGDGGAATQQLWCRRSRRTEVVGWRTESIGRVGGALYPGPPAPSCLCQRQTGPTGEFRVWSVLPWAPPGLGCGSAGVGGNGIHPAWVGGPFAARPLSTSQPGRSTFTANWSRHYPPIQRLDSSTGINQDMRYKKGEKKKVNLEYTNQPRYLDAAPHNPTRQSHPSIPIHVPVSQYPTQPTSRIQPTTNHPPPSRRALEAPPAYNLLMYMMHL